MLKRNTDRTSNPRERGQALMESALVILIFLSFLIGTLDFGQFLFFHQTLVERARAAARYGAVNPTDSAGTVNVAVYNTGKPCNERHAIFGKFDYKHGNCYRLRCRPS